MEVLKFYLFILYFWRSEIYILKGVQHLFLPWGVNFIFLQSNKKKFLRRTNKQFFWGGPNIFFLAVKNYIFLRGSINLFCLGIPTFFFLFQSLRFVILWQIVTCNMLFCFDFSIPLYIMSKMPSHLFFKPF